MTRRDAAAPDEAPTEVTAMTSTVVVDFDRPGVPVIDREGVTHTIREPERCVVVRTSLADGCAYLTEERGPVVVGAPLAVDGRVGEDAEDRAAAYVAVVALHVAQEMGQRSIQIARVSTADVGQQLAVALREAGGFYVIEFEG